MTGSTSSKNSEMSETKPPEGYETWLDYLLNEFRNGFSTPVMIANRELADIRAKAAAYDEAMRQIYKHHPRCRGPYYAHFSCGCELCTFVNGEREANRFTP